MSEVPQELRAAAAKFTREHLAFLDRNWLYDVLDRKLADLLNRVVKEHTSTTSNTALREACKQAEGLADHALQHLPSATKGCRCRELNDGEHSLQPICSVCAIKRIKYYATQALETP